MSQEKNDPKVATKLQDLKWFEEVVANSERVLSEVPEQDKSSWYKKYETTGDLSSQ